MHYAVIILLVVQFIQETKLSTTTLSPKERINILRQKINEEIQKNRNKKFLYPLDVKDSFDDYEYVQDEKLPITPIMDEDIKKKNEKFKLKTIKNKLIKAEIKSNCNGSGFESLRKDRADDIRTKNNSNGSGYESFGKNKTVKSLRSNYTKVRNRKAKRIRKKPIEIFYRREYNPDILQDRMEWLHCQDMITPLLTGVKVNISNPKRMSSKDPTILRFLQLLNVNTSLYSRDDIYSILYQISNLQLRLFQWDVVPLNMLLNVVIKEKKHTFLNLKYGLRELFENWRLDTSNTTVLLRQARLFRPPCIQVSKTDGSTKSPKVTKFKKKGQTETTPCDYDDEC